jgi:hypothetical protein
MWPGIRFPLMTRDGLVPAPIEPGARWIRVAPCEARPPRKPWRFTTPWKPRPLVVPGHLHPGADLEGLDRHLSPTDGASPSPRGNSRRIAGAASRPAFFACRRSAFVARVSFCCAEPELHRL